MRSNNFWNLYNKYWINLKDKRKKKLNKKWKKLVIKTKKRSLTITNVLLKYNFLVYNGKTYVKVFLNENMVGHKLGEFVITRNILYINKYYNS